MSINKNDLNCAKPDRFLILFFAFLLINLLSKNLNAQDQDTTKTPNLIRLESKIDSLQKKVIELDSLLRKINDNRAQGTDEVDKLLSLFNEEDDPDELIIDDQRSKRKRVDALLRAMTQRPGQLRFNGGASTVIQWKPSSKNDFVTGSGSFDLFAHTSFGENTLLFFDFEAIGGNGPSDFISTFSDLNGDAGSTQSSDGMDRITILEAWTEFTALDNLLQITAGKIDLTNYFDNNLYANDETSQFITTSFVNSAALPIPSNTPGIRIRTTFLDRFFIQAGFARTKNSSDSLFTNIFKIGSIGFKVFPQTGWEANLRIYTYNHPAAKKSLGFGISFDEAIASYFNVFGRYTFNQKELSRYYGVEQSFSFGIGFSQTLFFKRI